MCCRISDDGIARKKAAELKSKSASTHKSMGMQITASRIEMLKQKKINYANKIIYILEMSNNRLANIFSYVLLLWYGYEN